MSGLGGFDLSGILGGLFGGGGGGQAVFSPGGVPIPQPKPQGGGQGPLISPDALASATPILQGLLAQLGEEENERRPTPLGAGISRGGAIPGLRLPATNPASLRRGRA